MAAGDQLAQDYNAFEGFASGGHETKAKDEIGKQLGDAAADDVRTRYVEALFTLYQLGWIPPGKE